MGIWSLFKNIIIEIFMHWKFCAGIYQQKIEKYLKQACSAKAAVLLRNSEQAKYIESILRNWCQITYKFFSNYAALLQILQQATSNFAELLLLRSSWSCLDIHSSVLLIIQQICCFFAAVVTAGDPQKFCWYISAQHFQYDKGSHCSA